jgi:2-C-methyl-D-erythritol 4-phosphate cytidylyltransferase
MNAALIVAAGGSTRMGFDKLLAPLRGEPVILRTLRAFENSPGIDSIWIVSNDGRSAEIRRLAAAAGLTKIRDVIPGGAERHLSVWNGLQAVPAGCDLIAVHDGARPLITTEQIARCLAAAATTGAAASARRVTDTVKRADDDGLVTDDVDRNGLWLIETPQVFRFPLLLDAYEAVIRNGIPVTDEVSAARLAGHPVQLVPNPSPNWKITYPGDLDLTAKFIG